MSETIVVSFVSTYIDRGGARKIMADYERVKRAEKQAATDEATAAKNRDTYSKQSVANNRKVADSEKTLAARVKETGEAVRRMSDSFGLATTERTRFVRASQRWIEMGAKDSDVLSRINTEMHKVSESTKSANSGLRGLMSHFRGLHPHINDSDRAILRFNGSIAAMGKSLKLLKLPVLFAGAGLAAQLINALAAAAIGLVGSLGPLSSVLVGYPAMLGALGQGFIAVKLGLKGVGDALKQMDDPEKWAEALRKLTPAQREFAREMKESKKVLDALSQSAAKGLMPGLTEALKGLIGNRGLIGILKSELEATGEAVGGLAVRFSEAMKSADRMADLKTIMAGNRGMIDDLGTGLGGLADALRHVMVAAQPFIEWIGQGIAKFGQWAAKSAEAGRETGKLAAFFERSKESIRIWGDFLGTMAEMLVKVGAAAKPLGDSILRSLTTEMKGVNEVLDTPAGAERLRRWFMDMHDPIWEMARLIRDLGSAMGRIGSDPDSTKFVEMIRVDLLPALESLVTSSLRDIGPYLIDLGESFASLFAILGGTNGPLVAMTRAIAGFIDLIVKVATNFPGGSALFSGLVTTFAVLKGLKFAAMITGLKGVYGWMLKIVGLGAGGGALSLLAGGGLMGLLGKGGVAAGGAGAAVRGAAGRGVVPVFVTNMGAGGALAGGKGGVLAGGKGGVPAVVASGGKGGKIANILRGAGPIASILAGLGLVAGGTMLGDKVGGNKGSALGNMAMAGGAGLMLGGPLLGALAALVAGGGTALWKGNKDGGGGWTDVFDLTPWNNRGDQPSRWGTRGGPPGGGPAVAGAGLGNELASGAQAKARKQAISDLKAYNEELKAGAKIAERNLANAKGPKEQAKAFRELMNIRKEQVAVEKDLAEQSRLQGIGVSQHAKALRKVSDEYRKQGQAARKSGDMGKVMENAKQYAAHMNEVAKAYGKADPAASKYAKTAAALANELGRVPSEKEIRVKMSSDDAERKAERLKKRTDDIKSSISIATTMKDNATATIDRIDRRMKGLKDRIVAAKVRGDWREADRLQTRLDRLKAKKLEQKVLVGAAMAEIERLQRRLNRLENINRTITYRGIVVGNFPGQAPGRAGGRVGADGVIRAAVGGRIGKVAAAAKGVLRAAGGARVPGGMSGVDRVPALLAPGEFVVTDDGERMLERMTGMPGVLDYLQGRQRPHMAAGGGRVDGLLGSLGMQTGGNVRKALIARMRRIQALLRFPKQLTPKRRIALRKELRAIIAKLQRPIDKTPIYAGAPPLTPSQDAALLASDPAAWYAQNISPGPGPDGRPVPQTRPVSMRCATGCFPWGGLCWCQGDLEEFYAWLRGHGGAHKFNSWCAAHPKQCAILGYKAASVQRSAKPGAAVLPPSAYAAPPPGVRSNMGGAAGAAGSYSSGSLARSLWDEAALAKSYGAYQIQTHNPSSTLPSGAPSDHARYPSRALDAMFSPATGTKNPKALGFYRAMIGRPGIHYAILGGTIWSTSRGQHSYSPASAHANHVHVSGFRRGGRALGRMIGLAGGGKVGDTVPAMLTPGEIVLNAGHQARLSRMIGGPAGADAGEYLAMTLGLPVVSPNGGTVRAADSTWLTCGTHGSAATNGACPPGRFYWKGRCYAPGSCDGFKLDLAKCGSSSFLTWCCAHTVECEMLDCSPRPLQCLPPLPPGSAEEDVPASTGGIAPGGQGGTTTGTTGGTTGGSTGGTTGGSTGGSTGGTTGGSTTNPCGGGVRYFGGKFYATWPAMADAVEAAGINPCTFAARHLSLMACYGITAEEACGTIGGCTECDDICSSPTCCGWDSELCAEPPVEPDDPGGGDIGGGDGGAVDTGPTLGERVQSFLSPSQTAARIAQIQFERLGIQQRLGGMYDSGGAARAEFIKNTIIPALQAELAAIQAAITMAAGDTELQNNLREAFESKQNEILQAQLEAQESIKTNTGELLKAFQGSLGFEFGGARQTDLLGMGVGA